MPSDISTVPLIVYPDSLLDIAVVFEPRYRPLPATELTFFPAFKVTAFLSITISLNPSPTVPPTDILSLLTSVFISSVPPSRLLLYQCPLGSIAAALGIFTNPFVGLFK